MLKAHLLDSIESNGIGSILHNSEANKILVSKRNGDVEVYSVESKKLKLSQTYPELLQGTHTEETSIKGLYMSNELSTVFARCERSLLLFNNTNLHQYDQIVDKRGIENCWIFEVKLPNHDDKMTYLIYSTKATSKIRMLIWEGRVYKKIAEASLSSDKETILSADSGQKGIILATDQGVYHWSYGETVLSRIDKIVRRKYPTDMVKALNELKSICNKNLNNAEISNVDDSSITSSSRVTKKSSIISFWKRQKGFGTSALSKVRYIFTPSFGNHIMLDGFTKNLFIFGLSGNDLPYIEAVSHRQFVEWNRKFSHVQLLSSNVLILYNEHTVRFVDYVNGFTFLEQEVPEGIRQIQPLGNCFFMVWTNMDELQLFQYQVDDRSDSSLDDDESICGDIYESDFYQLWRKVEFYNFFLGSPDALQLCQSKNKQDSLNLCALKLRDLTVLFCLNIYDRFQGYMDKLHENGSLDVNCIKLQEVIVQEIFDNFIKFWAPPQLVLVQTFPTRISKLVIEMTGQMHNGLITNATGNTIYDLPKDLLRKWLLPYLVDIRRILRNLSKNRKVSWRLCGRCIDVGIDFFLLDKHGAFDMNYLLTLIDTVLFEVYLFYFPTMVTPLLSVENLCDYDIVVQELQRRHNFQELISFYFQRGKHEEALLFLTDLYNNTEKQIDVENVRDGIRILIIDYLKKLSPDYQDLIFEYTKWLLLRFESKRDILQEIFLDDSPSCADRNHMKIYDFLDELDKEISLKYIEFVISDFKSRDVKLHTILLKRYFQDLGNKTTRMKLKSVLEGTSIYEPRTILRLLEETHKHIPSSNTDQSNFIEGLKIYPLKRLGKYNEAVDILYEKLNEYDSASVFCEKIYQNDEEAGKSVLIHFFKKILDDSFSIPKASVALFLQEHSSKLDTIEIYTLLPDSLTLSDLKQVLLQTLKSQFIKKDHSRMRKNLLQVDLISAGYELNKELSKYVTIDENYKCPICRKTFKTGSADTALWFDSNNKSFVSHYTCGKAFEGKVDTKKAKAKQRLNRTVNDIKSTENNKIQ